MPVLIGGWLLALLFACWVALALLIAAFVGFGDDDGDES